VSDLIDALLRLSRLSRQRMHWGPVDLSALAHEVLQDLRDAEPARNVTVYCEPRLYVWGDAPLLRIVLQNLLGNAWKFSRHADQPTIGFGRDPHHRDRYYVHDNGHGFDSRYVDRLFGAFQRLHSEEEFEGTGIGLVTVKRIVLRHGGSVWAESKAGAGATFWFELRPARAVEVGNE
jgi:signal transduction histidine kinase